MNVTDFFQMVKRQFGDEYDVIVLNTDIYGWIYEGELDIIRNTGGNEQKMTQSTTLFPLAIPDNVRIVRLLIGGSALTYLPPNVVQDQGFNFDAIGARTSWYQRNNVVTLYPSDSLVANVDIFYTKTPTMFTDPVGDNAFTIPERYHTDLYQFCLARAHNKNRNFQAEAKAMEMYDRSLGIRREEESSIEGAVYKGTDPMDLEDFWYE